MDTRQRKSKQKIATGKTAKQQKNSCYEGRTILNAKDVLNALEIGSDIEEGIGKTSSNSDVAMDTKQTDVAIDIGITNTAAGLKLRERVVSKMLDSHKVRQLVSGGTKPQLQHSHSSSREVRERRQKGGKKNSEIAPTRGLGKHKSSCLTKRANMGVKQPMQALKFSSEEESDHGSESVGSGDEFAIGATVPELKCKERVSSEPKAKKTTFPKRKARKVAVMESKAKKIVVPHSRTKNTTVSTSRRKKWQVHRLSNHGVLLRVPAANQQQMSLSARKVHQLSNHGVLLGLSTVDQQLKGSLSAGAMLDKNMERKSPKRETLQKLNEEISVLDDSLEPIAHDSTFQTPEHNALSCDEGRVLAHDLGNKSHDNYHTSPDTEKESCDQSVVSPDTEEEPCDWIVASPDTEDESCDRIVASPDLKSVSHDKEQDFVQACSAAGPGSSSRQCEPVNKNSSLVLQTQFRQDQKTILDQFPGRRKQIETLKSLFGEAWETAVPLIYVYGHPSTGKTAVLQSLLREMKVPHAFVNCIECYTPRILFESILNRLSGVLPSSANRYTGYFSCSSMATFVHLLRRVITERGLVEASTYLVLDRAERLRDTDPALLSAFLRMSELARSNVCVVLVSQLVWERFFVVPDSPLPFVLYFPHYTKEEVLSILSLDCPVDYSPSFYCTFVSHVWNVLHKVCQDLSELRQLSSLLFPLYIAPIKSGEVDSHETMKLWKHIEPYFKSVMSRIYLGDLSSFQWGRMQKSMTVTGPRPESSSSSIPELPIHSKFLLIASYLASYNPAKTDQRFFAKGKLRKMKQYRKQDQPNHQELGPKVFPLDRMLAIFYSILECPLVPSADILSQVTSLVTVKLIACIGMGDLLDSPKFKCLVTFDFIREVARSVQFDIVKYLYDFN